MCDSRCALFDPRIEHAYVQMGMTRIEIDRVCSSRFRFSRRRVQIQLARARATSDDGLSQPLRYHHWLTTMLSNDRITLFYRYCRRNFSSTTPLGSGRVTAGRVFATPVFVRVIIESICSRFAPDRVESRARSHRANLVSLYKFLRFFLSALKRDSRSRRR